MLGSEFLVIAPIHPFPGRSLALRVTHAQRTISLVTGRMPGLFLGLAAVLFGDWTAAIPVTLKALAPKGGGFQFVDDGASLCGAQAVTYQIYMWTEAT
jgi:hypothetical protein